jgi:hypothetical protein
VRRWDAAALRRWSITSGIVCSATARMLAAQGPVPEGFRAEPIAVTRTDTAPAPQRPSVPPLVRYGKWIALGGAGALGYVANARNHDAEATYRSLRTRCFDVPFSCLIGPDGHYTDPVSEGLYTRTQRLDREASRYLIGAEVAVAAAAVGFVWELMHRQDRTPTIPFEPRVEQSSTSTRVGLTFRF